MAYFTTLAGMALWLKEHNTVNTIKSNLNSNTFKAMYI